MFLKMWPKRDRGASRIAKLFVKEGRRQSLKITVLLSTNRTENHIKN